MEIYSEKTKEKRMKKMSENRLHKAGRDQKKETSEEI